MVLDKQFLFIIGSPKSGTTWLQVMLAAHPQITTTVELTLFNRYTGPWIRAWKEEVANMEKCRWYQGLPFLWTEQEFYCFLRKFLQEVYQKVVEGKREATHVLDKHPGYSMHIEEINKLLPNARFIHVIRDGRDVAVSMMSARREIGYGTSTIRESALAWKQHVKSAQVARQYPERYMEVRYEKLHTDGATTIESVFNFCGLSVSLEKAAVIAEAHQFEKMKVERQHADERAKTHAAFYRKGIVGDWKGALDPVQRYLFDQLAGDLLNELGYAEHGWWAESGRAKLTLPVLAAISRVRAKISHC